MGRESEEKQRSAGRLFTSIEDFLGALPTEEDRGDELWSEQPVDLKTWLYEPEYMNLDIRLSPIQFEALSAMDDCNEDTNRFTEFVFEWGKGSGKDFISALAGLRQVYFLLCMRNPYDFYGLAKNTGIQLVNVAYTKDQAKNVFLKQVKGLLKGSPWFRQRIDVEKAITRERILFPHEIEFVSASCDGDSVEGQNMFFAVMDEASAFKDANVIKSMARADGVKADRAADAIYDVLRTSTRSRFMKTGKVVIISYPRYRDDFTQTKRKENERSEFGWTSGPYATWEVNPRVTEADLKATDEYKYKPEKAAAMYECKPPYSEDAYVAFPQRFIDCVMSSVRLGIESPMDRHGSYSWDFKGTPGRYYAIHVDLALRKDRCALALARQGEPVISPKCPCNKWNLKDVDVCAGCGRSRDKWIKQELPTMVVTLLKSFAPKELNGGQREVDFSDVRDEILWIRDRGHKIYALSYDGWQSTDSIQIMQKLLGRRTVRMDRWGEKTREEDIVQVLSVDRNTEAHDTLKEFIYDGRFYITPPNDLANFVVNEDQNDWDTSDDPVAIAFREWRGLRQINAKKIDHPIGGSKDFVDALAGAAYHIGKMPLARVRMPVVGGWSEAVRT